MAEIVNCRVVQELGLESVQYHLARIGDNFGVISQDFHDNYFYSDVLDDILITFDKDYEKNFGEANCIKYLSDKLYKNPRTKVRIDIINEQHVKQMGLASLILVGTAGKDGHIGNIAVYEDEKDKEKDGVILFDFASTYVNDCENIKDVENKYLDNKRVMAIFGIEHSVQLFDEYYDNIRNSPYIQTSVIGQYLTNLDKFLSNNNGMKKVVEDIEDEYGMKPDETYINCLNEVMRLTGKEIEDAYSDRLSIMGE